MRQSRSLGWRRWQNLFLGAVILLVLVGPYTVFPGPFGTDDVQRHVLLTTELRDSSNLESYSSNVSQTLLAPLASTPPGLYFVGASLMELAGIDGENAASVSTLFVLLLTTLSLFVFATRQFRSRSILPSLFALFYFSSPGILINVNQYVTGALALPYLLMALALTQRPPDDASRIGLLGISVLILGLAHVGTFFFVLLFLPVYVWFRIMLGVDQRFSLAQSLTVMMPLMVYFSIVTFLPIGQNAFQARAQISVLPRFSFLPIGIGEPLAALFDAGLVEGRAGALLLIAILMMGTTWLIHTLRRFITLALTSRFGLSALRSPVAAAAFSFSDLFPRSLPRTIATLPILLGPAQFLAGAFFVPRHFRLAGKAFLASMAFLALVLFSGLDPSAQLNPRDYYFLVIGLAMVSASGVQRLVTARPKLRAGQIGTLIIATIAVGGAIGQGVLTGLLYIPSISQEPEEALAQAWIVAAPSGDAFAVAPAFGGVLAIDVADLHIQPRLTNQWYSALWAMYNGNHQGVDFLQRNLEHATYAIQTEKADRLQRYNGQIASSGIYCVYSQEEVSIFILRGSRI